MIFHLGIFIPQSMFGRSLARTLFSRSGGSGWVGVNLYFVRSGFLSMGILFDSKPSRSLFRTFFRLKRSFPLPMKPSGGMIG
jgi:peptidoglycan/LPS O-acetylase OafA/YrhL